MSRETPLDQDINHFLLEDIALENYILNLDATQLEQLEIPQDFTASKPTTSILENILSTPEGSP